MILYESDIYKRKAYIDTTTKNLSFTKMSIILKRLGVSNNKFPLTIYNKDLIGRDPHNLNDPSTELRLAIGHECFYNPWYYFREVIRIPAQGSDPVPFILNRANCALIWTFYNSIDLILVIPRQTGKTMSTQGIVSNLMYISGKNLNIAMLTNSSKLVRENVSRLKDIRDGLPDYLVLKQPKDIDNKEGISYALKRTHYKTYVAQNDKSGADSLGRGMTVPVQHWDEAGMFPNIKISYPVALNSSIAAVETAKANNQQHTNIITTTAGKLDTNEGRFVHSLITNSLNFTEKIYDCKDKTELLEVVEKGSSNQMMYMVFSYLQLGYTHEWFREKSRRSGGTQDDIDRDFLNMWKLGAASGVIPQHLLKLAKQSERDPLHTQIDEGYIIKWYIDKNYVESKGYKDTTLILGMDSSENVGRDFTSLTAIDARNLRTAMTARCNESNIIKLAKFVARLLIKYPNMLFVPERNSTGCAIIDLVILELQKVGMNPYTRIFNQVVQNKDDDSKFQKYNINDPHSVDGTVRKYFGFRTTGSENSRKYLYKTVLMKGIELIAEHLYDSNLIQELSGLVIKNERIDHGEDGNDDTVISWLLALYVLFAGKNLSVYGIESKTLLSHMSETVDSESTMKSTQEHIRKTIHKYESKINTINNEILRASYIRKLNELKSQLVDDYDNSPITNISEEQLRESNKKEKQELYQQVYNEDTVEAMLRMI